MKFSKPVLITSVTAVVLCTGWFGLLAYISSPAYAEKVSYEKTYGKYEDDPHFDHVDVDGIVWYDFYYTDYFMGQSFGNCTHDSSYTEPVIPAGKYYPDGKSDSDIYLNITEENGRQFLEFMNADGTSHIGTDESDPFYRYRGKQEFVVITDHVNDMVYLTTAWCEREEWENNVKYKIPDPGELFKGEKRFVDTSGFDYDSGLKPIIWQVTVFGDGSVSLWGMPQGEDYFISS